MRNALENLILSSIFTKIPCLEHDCFLCVVYMNLIVDKHWLGESVCIITSTDGCIHIILKRMYDREQLLI